MIPLRLLLKRLFCWHLTWERSTWPAVLPWKVRYRCARCGHGRDFDWDRPPISRIQ